MFHLIAHTGLRRGEGCGQRRSDTYLDAASPEVANQIVQYGWETGQSRPKTPSSEGVVALEPNTVLVLRAHLARQDEAKARLGDDWVEHDLLFAEPDGSPVHPADEFGGLIKLAGLPLITLHGLRHGAATPALGRCVRSRRSVTDFARSGGTLGLAPNADMFPGMRGRQVTLEHSAL